MANYAYRLPIVEKGDSPYIYAPFQAGLTGADGQYFYAQDRYWKKGSPQVWELVSLIFQIVTSADVANRYQAVYLKYDDVSGGSVNTMGWGSAVVVASKTALLQIAKYGYQSGASIGAIADVATFVGIGNKSMLITNNTKLAVYATAGHANDAITGFAVFKYLNHELGIRSPYEIWR